MYRLGQGIKEDKSKALEYYLQGGEKGKKKLAMAL